MRFVGCLRTWLLFYVCVSILTVEKAEGAGEAVHILDVGTPRPANLLVPRGPAGAPALDRREGPVPPSIVQPLETQQEITFIYLKNLAINYFLTESIKVGVRGSP